MRAVFYLILCIVLWSFIPVFTKFAGVSLDHHQYLFYSSIISFLSVLFFALISGDINGLARYKPKTYALLFFLGFLDFFYYLLLYFGYQKAGGLEVLAVQYTWPIFIVILSVILLNERLNSGKIFALGLGFLGTFVVLSKGDLLGFSFSNVSALLIVCLGAFSFALFSVLSKRVAINPQNAVAIYFFSAIIYSFFSVLFFSEFRLPSASEWGFILINGIFLNGISYLFWIKALRELDASFAALFIFVIPVLSAFLLVLFFDEEILKAHLISLALVIVSGILARRK